MPLRIEDWRELRRGWIEDMEAGLHGHDQRALGADGERADVFRCRPLLVSPAGRIEAVDRPPLDVDPVENVRLRIPKRTLAKQRLGVEDAFDGGHDCVSAQWISSASRIA